MTHEPTLLFLHGVGNGDPGNQWRARLNETLLGIGYPGLDDLSVIAPKYAHALKGWDEKVPLPEVTMKQPTRDAAKKNRREFERRMGAIEFRLGRHDGGTDVAPLHAAVALAVELPSFEQARNYLRDPEIRAQVLTRILEKLPSAGRIVIVGHSLGSVIAADLVNRLPIDLEVAGLITIGSPLANGQFNVDKLREGLKEPPTNLNWWVNFWNAPDPVAAHRGVSSVFPWMIDFRVDTRKLPGTQAHAATEYLGNVAVGEAVGFALFGSRSKEVATINRGVDLPLDSTEFLAVLALRYAYLVNAQLDGDTHDRFTGARRQVQATVVDGLVERKALMSRPVPSDVSRLAFDFSDTHVGAPEPAPVGHMSKEDAIGPLVVLTSENVIQPFEITVPKEKREAALRDLTAELGLGSTLGAEVFAATKIAQDTLTRRDVNWLKWGAIGAGAAALVVATGGLALAAGAGLAGAALITSALATFGPGGMLGGLLTAGALVSAGGGGIAYGLASPATTAETLEAVVARQLTVAILRQRQQLEPDTSIWRNLVETEMEVRRQRERLDEFSDDSAVMLKELQRKLTALERALKYMRENGLEPDIESTLSAESS